MSDRPTPRTTIAPEQQGEYAQLMQRTLAKVTAGSPVHSPVYTFSSPSTLTADANWQYQPATYTSAATVRIT